MPIVVEVRVDVRDESDDPELVGAQRLVGPALGWARINYLIISRGATCIALLVVTVHNWMMLKLPVSPRVGTTAHLSQMVHNVFKFTETGTGLLHNF